MQKECCIFAGEMKKKLYILTLWAATFLVLLSTVMMHHHHLGGICMVIEQCAIDGNENDEHTEHHEEEGEENGCAIQQMHTFLINAKTTYDVELSLVPLPYTPLVSLLYSNQDILYEPFSYTLLYTIEPTSFFAIAGNGGIDRRGPPCL